MKYSLLKGLLKASVQVTLFGLPIVLNALPHEWMNLTVGGIGSLLINYLKVRWQQGTPNI